MTIKEIENLQLKRMSFNKLEQECVKRIGTAEVALKDAIPYLRELRERYTSRGVRTDLAPPNHDTWTKWCEKHRPFGFAPSTIRLLLATGNTKRPEPKPKPEPKPPLTVSAGEPKAGEQFTIEPPLPVQVEVPVPIVVPAGYVPTIEGVVVSTNSAPVVNDDVEGEIIPIELRKGLIVSVDGITYKIEGEFVCVTKTEGMYTLTLRASI